MCTLSVIPRDNGYLLGMNRDERIARGAGLPPAIWEVAGSKAIFARAISAKAISAKAIYPTDGDGGTSSSGTWIGVNEYGVALALLNWNDVTSPTLNAKKSRSRGVLIPVLIGSSTLPELQTALADLDVEGILPFRLVGVFPPERKLDEGKIAGRKITEGKIAEGKIAEGKIGEWRWNSVQMEFVVHPWEARHWFSSSLSDSQAENLRGAGCRDAWTQPDAGSAPWLRRLHASHIDGRCASVEAFSICVHRPEVQTLSYSEIDCTSSAIRVKHSLGSPCMMQRHTDVEIELVRNVGTSFASSV